MYTQYTIFIIKRKSPQIILNLQLWDFFPELQIIFTVVSVFTKENFNPFSNLISPFGIGTHEIQWLFSIFLAHNWSPIYLLL